MIDESINEITFKRILEMEDFKKLAQKYGRLGS